ncbi:hypothetical protein MSG28_002687 [Choristoneura fumiferana]|uniref:Uncharacterized protein n=1 Tax=Choristoneura fumiferana TaxID=7141 RepID=A0ACC0JIX3_CHOFU|nr:hypothetical protein MSG28_002687 [Choristoneura fumiferana]
MGGAPASPSLSRSPHVARTPTPSASPAASPAPSHDHGGGHHHHMAPIPPGYRYFKVGLFGGAPVWPNKDEERRRPPHINKVSILKRRTPPRPRFAGKSAPGPSEERPVEETSQSPSETREFVLYAPDGVDYAMSDDAARMGFSKDDDEDDDIEEIVEEHLDDADIVVVEPGAISPEERIATEEDFEELIDSGKPEDEVEEEAVVPEKTTTRTETTTKTVAVISLSTANKTSPNVQQYKLVNPSQNSALSRLPVLSATVLSPHSNNKILNEVSQATVASVSIANQTISVPVLKNLSVPIGGHGAGAKAQLKKMPLNLHNPPLTINMSTQPHSKPISSVISVISSNLPKAATLNPVITLATQNTAAGASRVPVSILTQHQVKQKIVKTIEKPMALSLSNTKLSSLSVSHDATLPAKIFQDDAASPDSTVASDSHLDKEIHHITTTAQHMSAMTSQGLAHLDHIPPPIIKETGKDIDIETEISQQTELPHSLCITDRTPLLLGKADIKSPDPIPEKIPDNIMEGDDDDKPEDSLQSNLLLSYNKSISETQSQNASKADSKAQESVVKTIKAIANQTKEMVIDSNMQITSDMAQESVQISIPSPTPSQERYLNDITMQEHAEAVEGNPKRVETFEDMLCMLENITDDAKPFGMKQPNPKPNPPPQNPNINPPAKQETKEMPTRQINTSNLPFNPQSISSSQPPALVMTSRPMMGNKEPPPNVTVRTHTIVSPGISQMQTKPAPGSINFITSSKLLHTQLTSPLKRSKSTDEPKTEVIVGHIQPTKRHSVESVIVKSEPMETDEPNATSTIVTDNAGNKIIQQSSSNQRNDDSQNVLLKQLLQTTTTAANVVPQRSMTMQRTAPALGTIPSLEAQLARPSIPPPTLALSQEVEIPKNSPRQIMTHSTQVTSPFTSRPLQSMQGMQGMQTIQSMQSMQTMQNMHNMQGMPIQTSIPTSSMSPLMHTSTQSLMDVRKPTMKIMIKEETTPLPESSPTIKTMQMYPMSMDNQQLHQAIKKEVTPPQQSPVMRPFTPMDVKKELLDESSQQSATSGVSTASDQGKLDQPMKEEYPEGGVDPAAEANAPETPSEAKKRKRREYQQKKRKQMQLNMRAAENNSSAPGGKKRPRKGSRYEEDYDTFIDNLMSQLRLLQPMQIQEPSLTTNFAVCPLFGSGDLTKLKNKDYDIMKGDLVGEFGNAKIPNVADYYNTKPFGDDEPLPEKPPASTQRGFYDQEFQPIVFEDDTEDKKLDFICKERDTDTPDSIVSCSSPECLEIEPVNRFPGLKLIDDDDEDEDSDSAVSGKVSPIIPLIAPVPVRVKPVSLHKHEDGSKALKCFDSSSPMKTVDSPGSTESSENVTVTLTLTSGAAEDILGVLKELAGILHIPPPTSYQIVERTATPPSHKLGLYRSKGKDGKEGTPIDIQSILNGAAKFCRHCDVVILDSVVRAKASEFPLLSANKGNAEDILCDSDSELYFCSAQCYERFAWRPTNIILDGKTKTAVKEDAKSDNETNVSKDRDDFDTASTESMETDDLDIKPDIKDEKMDLSFIDSLDNDELMKEVGEDVSALDEDLKNESDEKSNQSVEKDKYRGIRYKAWSPGCIGPPIKYKRPTDRELTELVFRTGVAIMPVTNEDTRRCELCGIQGDGVADGVSRLLNCDVDRWVHLNCALWSEGVYETVSGALMNVEAALAAGGSATCAACRRLGATVRCFKVRCGSVYHLGCAVKDNCVFYKNKTAYCASHAPKFGRSALLEGGLAVNPSGCARSEPLRRGAWRRAAPSRVAAAPAPAADAPFCPYSKQFNRGIYMFRLDERRVVDATLSGGLARYINHSCQPNCVAETVEVDRQLRIIIFAKRRVARGEELAYDYKFDIEDDAHKIMCMCGAPNCRKWMN